jgi:hypothetical protein
MYFYCEYKLIIETNVTSHKTDQLSIIIELITSLCAMDYYKYINSRCMLHI